MSAALVEGTFNHYRVSRESLPSGCLLMFAEFMSLCLQALWFWEHVTPAALRQDLLAVILLPGLPAPQTADIISEDPCRPIGELDFC